MQFPPGRVAAISVFFGQQHQEDFSDRRKQAAIGFIQANKDKDVVAIVYYYGDKSTKLYQSGRWSDYSGRFKRPNLKRGRRSIGGGDRKYIPKRITAIVVALNKADEHQLSAIARILGPEAT